jgi:hypothetical protein
MVEGIPSFEFEKLCLVRKHYSIPDEYKAYRVDYEVWKRFAKKPEAEIDCQVAVFGTSCEFRGKCGCYRARWFVMVAVGDTDTGSTYFLFTADIEKFWRRYFKNNPVPLPNNILACGVYQIVQGLMGYEFKLVDTSDEQKPIFNDHCDVRLEKEVNSFLKMEDVFAEMRMTYKRGILLFGSAGNGKTSFIRYLANKMRHEAITILLDRDVGKMSFLKGFLACRDNDDKLKMVVFEDIDGFEDNIRSQLLNFLDGMARMHRVLFIATTNFPERLDIAIKKRPSRFDVVIKVDAPDSQVRKQLIRRYFPAISDSDLDSAAKEADGFSGAYFKELFIFSRLNNVSLLEAIREIKRRFSLMNGD